MGTDEPEIAELIQESGFAMQESKLMMEKVMVVQSIAQVREREWKEAIVKVKEMTSAAQAKQLTGLKKLLMMIWTGETVADDNLDRI